MNRNSFPPQPVMLPALGETIVGKYTIRGVLGRGGMGVVFDGYHELLDRRVAIKVLAPEILGNQEAVTRFLNEARAAARVSSEHVVQVLDVGRLDNGLPFIVMERLEGADLAQLAASGAIKTIEETVDLIVEGCEGVAHAHFEGIVHRDLKPSNLFLARKSDRSAVVKVLDFGISKLSDTGGGGGNVTSTSAVFGSPNYMSPEQFLSAKGIDLRTDIWSLGAIAYQFLTGRLPYVAETMVAIYAAIQEGGPRPLRELRSEIPLGLEAAVLKCLRKSREERYPTVVDMVQALAPFGTRRSLAVLDRLEQREGGITSTVPVPSRGALPLDSARVAVTAAPKFPSTNPPVSSSSPFSIAARSERRLAAPAPPATAAPWSSTGGKSGALARGTSAFAIVVAVLGVFVLSIGVVMMPWRPPAEPTMSPASGKVSPAALVPAAPSAAPASAAGGAEKGALPPVAPAPALVASSVARVAPLTEEPPPPAPALLVAKGGGSAEKRAAEPGRPQGGRANPPAARGGSSDSQAAPRPAPNPLHMQPF